MKTFGIIGVIIFVCIFSSNAIADWNTQSMYDFLKKKYGSINTVSLDFRNADINNVNGTLFAKKGGIFKIDFGSRTLQGDGKFIYNYSKQNNRIVKSNISSMEDNSSLESILFSFINDFTPIKFEKLKNSEGQLDYVLTMIPKEKDKFDINSLMIWIDIDKIILKGIQINQGSHYQHWLVSNLKINTNLPTNALDISFPKDADIIDLTGK